MPAEYHSSFYYMSRLTCDCAEAFVDKLRYHRYTTSLNGIGQRIVPPSAVHHYRNHRLARDSID